MPGPDVGLGAERRNPGTSGTFSQGKKRRGRGHKSKDRLDKHMRVKKESLDFFKAIQMTAPQTKEQWRLGKPLRPTPSSPTHHLPEQPIQGSGPHPGPVRLRRADHLAGGEAPFHRGGLREAQAAAGHSTKEDVSWLHLAQRGNQTLGRLKVLKPMTSNS